jgi:hypothetical protein
MASAPGYAGNWRSKTFLFLRDPSQFTIFLHDISLGEIQRRLDPDILLLEYSLGSERSFLWAVTQTTLSSFELPKRAEIESKARVL